MTVEITSQLSELRGEVTALIGATAKMSAICEVTKTGVESAANERRELWVQIRGYGEKLIEVTNAIKVLSNQMAKVLTDIEMLKADRITAESITTTLGKLASDVESFKIDRAMVTGGYNTAGALWNFGRVVLGFVMGAAPFVVLWLRNELAK